MANKPEPPQPVRWDTYRVASEAKWIGEVEATDESAAIEKAAEQYKVPGTRLMATRRR